MDKTDRMAEAHKEAMRQAMELYDELFDRFMRQCET